VYVRNEPAGPALSVARERDGGIGIEGSATCTTPPTDSRRSTNASRPIPCNNERIKVNKQRTQTETALRWWALLCWSALERNRSEFGSARTSSRSLFCPEMRRAAVAKGQSPKAKGHQGLQQMNEQGLDGRPRADGRGEWPPFAPRAHAFPSVCRGFLPSNKRCGPTAGSLSPSRRLALLQRSSVPPPLTLLVLATTDDPAGFWCLAFVSLWGCLSPVGIKRSVGALKGRFRLQRYLLHL